MSIFPQVRFQVSVAAPGQFPPDFGWEVAIAGRSNAGKSSVINALLARKGLAKTSCTPGRTRLYNYFELTPERRLVDLPGYGHAAVNVATRESWEPLGEALLERESFAALLLVVDCRRGVSDMDIGLLDWAHRSPQRTHVLLNKSDKLSKSEALKTLRSAKTELEGRASCQLFSALRGEGMEEARKLLLRWTTQQLEPDKEIAPAV
ncbi:MAG: ribosome biogenesis GTP-binding protein YihA/YsxC [Pseudomonadota bacterium]